MNGSDYPNFSDDFEEIILGLTELNSKINSSLRELKKGSINEISLSAIHDELRDWIKYKFFYIVLNDDEKLLTLIEEYFDGFVDEDFFTPVEEELISRISRELIFEITSISSSLHSQELKEIRFLTLEKKSEFIGFLKGYFYCLEKRQISK